MSNYYRHFKGRYYEALMMARSALGPDEMSVVYRNVETNEVWIRPYKDFHGLLAGGRRRFKWVDRAEIIEHGVKLIEGD